MNKKILLIFILGVLQATYTAKPIADIKSVPQTQMVNMANNVITATTPVDTHIPQPVQISEQHLAGHVQPLQGPVAQSTQPALAMTPTDAPVNTSMQATATPVQPVLTQTAPITLTPNTPKAVNPIALKAQLEDIQKSLQAVIQQMDMITPDQN